jgi:hypothetical protein
MQDNNLAIIVPVHFPKIDNLKNLYSSYLKIRPDVDLFAIISEEEADKLEKYKEILDENHLIICPQVNSSKSPVTYKKMYGLHHLYKQNKYYGYAAIDSESLFLKSGFEKSFFNFYNSREIVCYPTDVDFLINIQAKSAVIYPENEELKTFKQQYSVWNTIPWFVDQHLSVYFKDSKYYDNYFFNCDWEVFDQLNYQAWLISKGLFKISKTQYRLEYPEDMPSTQQNIFFDIKVDWIRYGARNLPCLSTQEPLMYFHVDRMG